MKPISWTDSQATSQPDSSSIAHIRIVDRQQKDGGRQWVASIPSRLVSTIRAYLVGPRKPSRPRISKPSSNTNYWPPLLVLWDDSMDNHFIPGRIAPQPVPCPVIDPKSSYTRNEQRPTTAVDPWFWRRASSRLLWPQAKGRILKKSLGYLVWEALYLYCKLFFVH